MGMFFPDHLVVDRTKAKISKSKIEVRKTESRLLEWLEKNAPHIEVDPNEDLNIKNRINSMLKIMWYDVKKYPTVAEIERLTGISQRQIRRIARDNEWFSRTALLNY